MNQIIDCLTTRRSVKNYAPQQVEKEKLDAVLLAGTYAANGMGKQAGKIVVLQNADEIAQLEQMNAAVMGASGAHPFYGAPTVLVVLADSRVNTCVEDGALVIGNLMNAAHSLGLGSCWVHRAREEFQTEEGKRLLKKWGVDEHYIGVGHCLLGYAAADPQPAKPRREDFIVFA